MYIKFKVNDAWNYLERVDRVNVDGSVGRDTGSKMFAYAKSYQMEGVKVAMPNVEDSTEIEYQYREVWYYRHGANEPEAEGCIFAQPDMPVFLLSNSGETIERLN